MKNDEKFEQIYNEILLKNIQKVEKSQHNNTLSLILQIILLFFLVLMSSLFEYVQKESMTILWAYNILFIGSLLSMLFLLLYSFKEMGNFFSLYKSNIIKPLAESFEHVTQFLPKSSFDMNEYIKADFEEFDGYSSEDLIIGSINNYKFSITKVETKHLLRNPSLRTIFNGIVAKFDITQNIDSPLYIRTDNDDKNIIRKIISQNILFQNLK